jgi:hypothetical protein
MMAAPAAGAAAGGTAAGLTASQLASMAIMAAGTMAQMSAARSAQNKQRNMMNQQLEREDEATDKSVDLVQEEGKNYDSQSRLQQVKDAQAKTYAQAQADIEGAGGGLVNTSTTAGAVSDDFLKSKAEAAITEGTRLTDIAREASRARAPGVMRMDDSLRMAGLTGDLANVWGGVKNMHRATGLDVQGVTPPAYGALGSIASSIAAPAVANYGQQSAPTGTYPPNPYATGPYAQKSRTAGINFGGR